MLSEKGYAENRMFEGEKVMNRTRLLALLLAAMMTVPAQMTAAAAQPQTAVQTGSVAVTQEDKSVETSLSSLENTTVGTTTEFTVTTRG